MPNRFLKMTIKVFTRSNSQFSPSRIRAYLRARIVPFAKSRFAKLASFAETRRRISRIPNSRRKLERRLLLAHCSPAMCRTKNRIFFFFYVFEETELRYIHTRYMSAKYRRDVSEQNRTHIRNCFAVFRGVGTLA